MGKADMGCIHIKCLQTMAVQPKAKMFFQHCIKKSLGSGNSFIFPAGIWNKRNLITPCLATWGYSVSLVVLTSSLKRHEGVEEWHCWVHWVHLGHWKYTVCSAMDYTGCIWIQSQIISSRQPCLDQLSSRGPFQLQLFCDSEWLWSLFCFTDRETE